MKNFKKRTNVFLFAAIILLSSCGGSENEPSTEDNGKDRKEILTHWADNIIIPSYARFRSKFDDMASKADAFKTSPSTTSLSELRNAWTGAYTEWQKTELFEFGPADRYTLRNFYNIYPTDVGGINSNINDASASLELPGSYARQGFPALDYLLNGTGDSDAAILAYFSTDADASKRLAYLTKIIARMDALLTNVIAEWSGSYRDTFISKTGLEIGSSTGLVVNAYVLYYERYVRSGKIGIPSGAAVSGGGTVQAEKVEAFYKKDISLILAKTAQQATHDFFVGKNILSGAEGPSFKSYLDALEAKDPSTGTLLSSLIIEQFGAIDSKLNVLSNNLYEEVQNNNQDMLDVFTAMQKMVRMLKVDMTSAMSVTITYTDNDGD